MSALASGPSTPRADLAARLLRGLRVAQNVIVLVVLFGLSLPSVLAGAQAYHPGWVGLAGWAVFVAIAGADAVLVVRYRSWRRARWPVAALVGVVAVGGALALEPAEVSGPAHIALGVAGWCWVLLFADARLRDLVAVLAAHLLVVLGLLVASGRTDQVTLVTFATTAVGVTSFQLAVGCAGAALRTAARDAVAAAEYEARARTADEIAAAVHADREARYAELRSVASPLLTGIGDGTASPADPDVQRAAAGAAARLRRMFAEEGADALAVELAALIDIAERRGVVVRYSERGPRPDPPPAAAGVLLDVAGAALHAAAGQARVTLAGMAGEVVVSVVTDRVPVLPVAPAVRTTTVEGKGETWVEMRWAPDR